MRIRFLILVLFFTSHYIAQVKNLNENLIKSNSLFFEILDSTKNSNISYKKLKKINKVSRGVSMLESIFSVKDKGKFTVYRLIAKDIGCVTHECESLDTLNWIVIFKTDKKSQIKDGYFYFLSESEMTKNGRLFRMRRKYLFYTNNLAISSFNFYCRKCENDKNLSDEMKDYKIIKITTPTKNLK